MRPAGKLVLGTRIHCTSYENACDLVKEWASHRFSSYVCLGNVYNVMESWDSAAFRDAINGADLVTPDGVPLVWALKLLGFRAATRVYGPDLTTVVLGMAERNGLPVGFYGGSPEVLARLEKVVQEQFPALRITYAWSPPFRPLSGAEDEEVTEAINASGARILFVGIGTPKQDYWMAAHRNRVEAVMLGVGAAFDFIAGAKRQAPRWVMKIGMEWFFRLVTEPRRLWKRYLKHNPRFIALFARQLLSRHRGQHSDQREC